MCASCLLVHCIHTSMLFYSLLSPLMPWIHPTMHPHNEQLVKILCCCHFFVNNCLFFFNYLTIPDDDIYVFFVSAFVLIMSPCFFWIFYSLSLRTIKMLIFSLRKNKREILTFQSGSLNVVNFTVPIKKNTL